MSNRERTLEKIMQDLDRAAVDIAKDLDSLPLRLRPTHEMAAREARDSIPLLKAEYRLKAFSNSLILFTSGGTKERELQYAAVAAEEGPTFTFDAEELYVQLAKEIEPAIGSTRNFSTEHLGMLNDLVWRAKRNASYAPPVILTMKNALTGVSNFAALVSHIRYLVTEGCGHGLNLTFMSQNALDKAMEQKFDGRTFVAVAVNARPEEAAHLKALFSRSSTVDLAGEEEINQAFAISSFKDAKSKKTKADQTKTNE